MSDPKDYTVGWICAITTEYVAAQCFLDERHDDPSYLPPNNKNDYTLGRIGKHNVVISVLPLGSQGSASAAQVAENMLHSFPNVRIGLLVGIGGGVPSPHDIRLGDVVVSTPSNGRSGVVQYDFGKTIQGQGFQPTGFLDQPPTVLRAAVSGLSAKYEIEGHQLKENVDEVLGKKPRLRKKYKRPEPDSDRLYQSHVVHREDSSDLIVREPRLEDEDDPVIHYGSIASANQSMNDALIRDKYGKAKGILCFEMEAAGLMNNFPCLVIRGICDYADSHQEKEEYAAWRGYAAMIAAAYAKDLLCRISPQHVETAQKAVEVLKISIDHIVETTDHVAAITERIDRNLSLDKLPTANAAEYNSHDDENEAECLEGTRTDLLRQITEWTSSPDGKCLFWLNGMAGTGKSTISRTVARSLKKRQKLGASFFFKRGEEDRGNAKKLFPSLAQQLVLQYPVLISRVRKAIEADPNIASKSLGEQFDQLLLQPLLDLEASGQENLVVLLDALDECDDDRDVRRIIRLMAQLQQVQAIRVRVFLTSRPELPIRLGFKNITDQDYQDLILHEIPERVTRHDISLFLKYRLTKIRIERDRIPYEWPTESIILSLVDMSVPLFISAATVCRYIEHSRFEPTARLQELLQDQTKYVTRMEKTYMPILTQLVNDLESDEIEQKQLLEDFQRIIGLILLLAVPLSIQSLSKLLNIETLPLRTHLDSFQSVLSVPNIGEDKPVRILHLSFRDFLTSTSDKRFRIEENTKHKDIFQLCLKTMNLHLKRNMCDLENPAAERANIDPQTIAHLFPPELSYACRYWGSHFERCDITEIEAVDLLLFLKEHLLHYIEAMALLGLVSEVPRVIGRLRSDDSVRSYVHTD
jgi:nucleoside phosphorylase